MPMGGEGANCRMKPPQNIGTSWPILNRQVGERGIQGMRVIGGVHPFGPGFTIGRDLPSPVEAVSFDAGENHSFERLVSIDPARSGKAGVPVDRERASNSWAPSILMSTVESAMPRASITTPLFSATPSSMARCPSVQ